ASTRWLQSWQGFCNAATVVDLASSADAGHKGPVPSMLKKGSNRSVFLELHFLSIADLSTD
ncbi:hypothetical protein Tco_0943191, partial [Tanacetum coccineum]